jgi:hypothetical protein
VKCPIFSFLITGMPTGISFIRFLGLGKTLERMRSELDLDVMVDIASKFAESHNNSMISPLSNMVRASCSVLRGGCFNTDASTSPHEIKGVVKKLRNGKARW